MKKLLDTFSQIEGKQTLTESESTSPFHWKTTPSQLRKKPGETAGFNSKKISTGTVYSRKPTKDKTDTVKESANFDESKLEQILARYNESMERIDLYSSGVDHSRVLDLLKKGDVESAAEEIAYSFSDEDGGEPRGRDDAQYENLKSELENLVNPADFDNISHGTDPEQRDQDELSMLKHFMQYGKEPQPGSQMASIKDRLSAKGMAEGAGQPEKKSAAEWLRDPRLETQVNSLTVDGIRMDNPAKGLKSLDNYPRSYDTTQASNPMYFKEFLAAVAKQIPDAPVSAAMSAVRPQPAMAEGAGQPEKKSPAEWLRDPRLETQVTSLQATGLALNNPAKGFKSFDDYRGPDMSQASNPMYFRDFLNAFSRVPGAMVTAFMSAVAPQPAMAEDDVEEGAGVMHFKAEKAKEAGKPTFNLGDEEFRVQECYDGSMSPMSGATQEESNLSVSTNMGTNSPLNVSVTATGGAARELMQMLRLAGLGSSEEMSDTTEPEVVIGAEEMEEDYANAPDEKYSTVDNQMNQGNGLNSPKIMHKDSYRQGDNPMAMREADELAALEKQLFEELSAIKIIKK